MKKKLNNILKNEYTLVFLFSALMLFCAAYRFMRWFDFPQAYDSVAYWGVANFNFQQSPIRRYRVIVPLLARGLSEVYWFICRITNAQVDDKNFPLRFSFMLVNISFVSLYIMLLYRFCRSYALRRLPSFLAGLFVLSSFTTVFVAAAPLVDSFLWFLLALMLVGIRERNHAFVYAAIFLGPFAKESFVFFVPVIFFFSNIPKLRQVGAFILSGILVFSFRYWLDHANGLPPTESNHRHIGYITEMWDTIKNMYRNSVFQDFVEGLGLWIVIPLFSLLLIKKYFIRLKQYWGAMAWLYFAVVLFQVCISGDYVRMYYLQMPFFALVIAASVQMALDDKLIVFSGGKDAMPPGNS